MKSIGIELKSNEARIVVLEGTPENYEILILEKNKIKLEETKNQESVKLFQKEFSELFQWLDPNLIGIKERMSKGRFAGGAISFKMEGLIQTTDYPINLIHSASIKSKLKDAFIDISGLAKYQEEAFRVALYLLIINHD